MRGPHKHTDLFFMFFTCALDQPRTHTYTQQRHLRRSVWGFGLSPYPWRPVLYPCTSHFLLVDDVHELDCIIALHVNHRPLQRILGHLVELGEDKRFSAHPNSYIRSNSFIWSTWPFVKDSLLSSVLKQSSQPVKAAAYCFMALWEM